MKIISVEKLVFEPAQKKDYVCPIDACPKTFKVFFEWIAHVFLEHPDRIRYLDNLHVALEPQELKIWTSK